MRLRASTISNIAGTVLSGLGIIGGSLTVFAGLRHVLDLSSWAHFLVRQYDELSALPWRWVGQLGWNVEPKSDDPLAYVFHFLVFALSISIGTRLRTLAVSSIGEVVADLKSGLWMSFGLLVAMAAAIVGLAVAGGIVLGIMNAMLGLNLEVSDLIVYPMVITVVAISVALVGRYLAQHSDVHGYDVKLRLLSLFILSIFFVVLVTIPRTTSAADKSKELLNSLFLLAPLTLLMVSVAAPKQFWERLLALAGGVIVLVVANLATVVVMMK